MSSAFKSKKGLIFTFMGIVLISIVVLLVGARSFPWPGGEKSIGSTMDQDNGGFTITHCEEYSPNVAVTITDVNGFVALESRTSATPQIIPGTPTPGPWVGIYEFVLQPGSTGEITMVYDYCPSKGKILDDNSPNNITLNSIELRKLFDQFNSTNHEMWRLNVDAANPDPSQQRNDSIGFFRSEPELLTRVPPGNSSDVKIYSSEISKVNEHSIEVIYTFSASPAADEATYITANFYKICPGEILTIGDEVNEESLVWSSGPFYGCTG
jgi:hypothetical protein